MAGKKDRRTRSETLKSVHDIAKDLHAFGAIDAATMREFDVTCLTDMSPFLPEEIRRLREEAGMTRAVFAMAVNVTAATIGRWERGHAAPTGPSLKLLSLARRKGIDAIL